MPRKAITKVNKLKERKRLAKAVKRGDVPTDRDPTERLPKRKPKITPSDAAPVHDAARKLQSAFTKVSREYLTETRELAAVLTLPHPIPPENTILTRAQAGNLDDSELGANIAVPRRPKWRFDMSKKEVDGNEEGQFKKWLVNTDALVDQWVESGNAPPERDPTADPDAPDPPKTKMPRSPTHFERNLEVWRQLWRVTEISQIILVLLDSRCPLLHYPPSLSQFLSDRKIILVLTKVDIVGPERAQAWIDYLSKIYPGQRVVQVESYTERTDSYYHQGKALYAPHVPDTFRERMVRAIQETHQELIAPPERLRDAIQAGTKQWKPPVKEQIDWDAVVQARGGNVGIAVGGAAAPKADTEGDSNNDSDFLTVGLIGQPNVGKSSLLNALFGTTKVRASRQPGKTKHFQTLFWTRDVRLVDCPGLVMPNLVDMELQVFTGLLPISRVSAIAACVHYVCQHLDLHKILDLQHPSTTEAPITEDKRTWRDGMIPLQATKIEPNWTAMDILVAYCTKKKWFTAKAGRPDISRAGNSILRTVAEGRVKWAFWPPGSEHAASTANGIWIPHEYQDDDGDVDSDEETQPARIRTELPTSSEDEDGEDDEESDEETSEEVTDESEDEHIDSSNVGRFSALQVQADEDASI